MTNLDAYIPQNWTTQEQVLPISLHTTQIDSNLLKAQETLKELVQQYRKRGQVLNKANGNNIGTKTTFFNNTIMDIFLFAAAILSMLATAVIVHLVCKHTKLKALLTGIAFQPVKQIKAIFDDDQLSKHFTMQWYTIAALTLMIVLLMIQKCTMFKKRLYSNTVTVMLFFSDVKHYVPVKLCKTAGSIHLFQIYGQLVSDQITLERRYLWDVIRINWGEVFVTLNGAVIQVPISVKVPLRDKYRLRSLMRKGSLLLHVMLRQEMSWYALDNVEYLLPPPHLEESEI